MTIVLADRSIKTPYGIISNVHVFVCPPHIYPINFVAIDMHMTTFVLVKDFLRHCTGKY
jgi:hypothetical protein